MASTQVAIIGNGIIGIIDELKYDRFTNNISSKYATLRPTFVISKKKLRPYRKKTDGSAEFSARLYF